MGVGQLRGTRFQFTPQLCAAMRRDDVEGEASVQIEAREVGFGEVYDDPIAMRVERIGQIAQERERAIVPQLGVVFAE